LMKVFVSLSNFDFFSLDVREFIMILVSCPEYTTKP
jgi:hypothetical protein